MWDLVPWPGIEPRPPASGVGSLNHWTIREVSQLLFFKVPSGVASWLRTDTGRGRGPEGSDQSAWALVKLWMATPCCFTFLILFSSLSCDRPRLGKPWRSFQLPRPLSPQTAAGPRFGREGNWMVKGWPGKQVAGWRAGGRRGRAFASLDVWKETLFFLWNLDIKLLRNKAPKAMMSSLGWGTDEGCWQSSSSLVSWPTPPPPAPLPSSLHSPTSWGVGKGIKTPEPLASSSCTRNSPTPGWEEPWSQWWLGGWR